MYTLSVTSSLIAHHYLKSSTWGIENEQHSHHYQIEVSLEGHTLDENGCLVDVVYLEAQLEAILRRYRDRLLNDLPEFAEINPTPENFAHILCQALASHIQLPRIQAISVKVWVDHHVCASYRTTA